MLFYLTINEFYSGIYQGQVIDLVKYINDAFSKDIRLVAFIPIKGFWKQRNIIKSHDPLALVFPMLPKQSSGKMWKSSRYTLFLLCKIYKVEAIIARNPISTWVALEARKKRCVEKVCYDGRGAIVEESKEYNIYPKGISDEIFKIEERAVRESDFRICITQQLLEYWVRMFDFQLKNYFIIPGTLNNSFKNVEFDFDIISTNRQKMGYSDKDILLVYSGSTEGWQSFNLLYVFLKEQFQRNSHVKVIFLSKEEKNIANLQKEFPQRVNRFWLHPVEVPNILTLADYGLILREPTITNMVALPTKFPEYLACGLEIIVNDGAKEVFDFVREHKCGVLLNETYSATLTNKTLERSVYNRRLALQYYSKDSKANKENYAKLLLELSSQ